MVKELAVGLMGALVVPVAACSSSGSTGTTGAGAGGSKIGVVAGENPWGDLAAQIGGDHVHVTSLIEDPGADPHLYESDTKAAAAVADAKLVVENGAGYDDFVDKLVKASPSSGRKVVSVERVVDLPGDDPNPHVWYDVAAVPSVAKAISAALTDVDPAHGPDYAANEQAFEASLRPITDVISGIRSKYAGSPVAYTERVAGYLIEAAGLTVTSPSSFAQAIEAGSDPSPQAVSQFEGLLTGKQVRVLIVNSQATSPTTQHLQDLARQRGVPIVGMSETIPKAERNFQSWQLDEANALLQALGG